MTRVARVWWIIFGLVTAAWLVSEPAALNTTGFVHWRDLMVQYSGILTMAWMSIALLLAVRPRWPERWLGGLDRMYRLHKWLGISALVMGVTHWVWTNAPKWGGAMGLLERAPRGPRPALANPIAEWFISYRGAAESIGEWAFYAATLLIVVALVKAVSYRLFYRTHRLLAVVYLALLFHTVILMKFSYWTSPVGLLFVPLLAGGAWAAVVVLLHRIAVGRKVRGQVASIDYYPGVRSLDVAISVPGAWHGHKPGQFAFVTSDPTEGSHPYTIASAWDDGKRRISFIVKELGDHTGRLRETLRVRQEVAIEGPYGCFTFDDTCEDQIWVGAGIGITPFIARMQHLATENPRAAQRIHLFHATAEQDKDAFAKLVADAEAAGVRLHLLVDEHDGRLDGDRIRAAVPAWREASIWFCGPAGFGEALRKDFAAAGMAVGQNFHQELFALR
jgi:predicted ferric reductase